MEDIAELVIDDLTELVEHQEWSPEHCDEILDKAGELMNRIQRIVNERRVVLSSESEI